MPNPPITVGELTDVPAPESPINAAFHQEVANRIVHRFATVAALNAWAAANGSVAYVTANDYHYLKVPDGWVSLQIGDPDWIAYTPTNPAGSGWSFSTATGRYMRSGSIVHVTANLSGFSNDVDPIKVSLPFNVGPGIATAQCLVDWPGGVITAAAAVLITTNVAQPYPSGDVTGTLDNNGFRTDHPYPFGTNPLSVYLHVSYAIG